MTCADFCTAATCRSLQSQIDVLKEELLFLQQKFFLHTSDPIPDAHSFDAPIKVDSSLDGTNLTTKVTIGEQEGADTIKLPDSVAPDLDLDIIPEDDFNYRFKVKVGKSEAEKTLKVKEHELGLTAYGTSPGAFGLQVSLGEQIVQTEIDVRALLDNLDFFGLGNLTLKLVYNLNTLTVKLTDGNRTVKDSVYIKSSELNIQRGSFGGGSGSNGEQDVTCEGLSAEFTDRIELVLVAIADLKSKVLEVEKYVTLDVEHTTFTELTCPEGEPGEGEPKPLIGTETSLEGEGLTGLYELAKIINDNLITLFEASCEKDGVTAFLAWWQVRLGSSVPQVVCIFRKAGSSTYHSIAIPHPANTEKPVGAVLPAYTKGNYMGMVTCRDNSKFIINCESEVEAQRMCNAAIARIDPEFLETPARVYIGQRKGQAVGVGSMSPTSVEYYPEGQQNGIPDWRVRLNKLEPQ